MKTSITLVALIASCAGASLTFAQATPQARATVDQRPSTNGQFPTTADHWSPFVGCWAPDRRDPSVPAVQRCVLPGSRPEEARLVTYSGESVVLEETIVADGQLQAMSDKSCTGDRTTRWSQTGTRFFYRTASVCANGPRTTTSGIGALVTIDQWLDIQSAAADHGEQVRVVRYWRSMLPPPPPIADQLQSLQRPRVPVVPVTAEAVVEASHEVTPAAIEAWIAESAVRLPIDRRALVRLDDEKVSPRVIDLLVAQAYPKKFEVRAGGSGSSSSIGSLFTDYGWYGSGGGLGLDFYGMPYDYFGRPFYFGWSPFYRTYDFAPVGSAFDVAGGGGGGAFVAAEASAHGQAVNGQGYTHVQPREAVASSSSRGSGGAATYGGGAGADSSGSGGGSSAASGGSAGASPAGYSGGGGGGTGLTAVPR